MYDRERQIKREEDGDERGKERKAYKERESNKERRG
jgi:hypothetical protein